MQLNQAKGSGWCSESKVLFALLSLKGGIGKNETTAIAGCGGRFRKDGPEQ
jgi:hypothetical protein